MHGGIPGSLHVISYGSQPAEATPLLSYPLELGPTGSSPLAVSCEQLLLRWLQAKYIQKGDSIVALHRIGNASVIKIVDIK